MNKGLIKNCVPRILTQALPPQVASCLTANDLFMLANRDLKKNVLGNKEEYVILQ